MGNSRGIAKLVGIPRSVPKFEEKNVEFPRLEIQDGQLQNKYKVTLFKANQDFTRAHFAYTQGSHDLIPQSLYLE